LTAATVLAVGLPAQRAIAQRFSALAHRVIFAALRKLVAIGAQRTLSRTRRNLDL